MSHERLSIAKDQRSLAVKVRLRLSHERIAASCRDIPKHVSKYLQRAQAEGLAWPLPDRPDG